MMSALILFLCPLLSTGVFGDNVLSVMEGESVTLHADAKIKINQIEWRFGQRLIASIYTQTNDTSVDPEGAFGGRLQLDNQTGDLKITNIRISDSGEYKLKINRKEPMTFTVSVVPANPVKTVSVMDGDSVTLTGVTELLRYDVMQWRFGPQHSLVAEINRKTGLFSTYDGPDGRFRDRLKLDYLTGSLTIRNIRTRHSGLYEVDIGTSKHTIHKSFNVTVSGEIKSVLSVMEGESVTLDTGLTEIQTDDSIHWMFGDTDIAEIFKAYNRFSFNDDERFRDRLKLDQKTGSLTITNIRTTDSGDYKLKIISSRLTVYKRITVTVTGSGLSSGAVVGIVVVILMAVAVAVAVAVVGVIYHRRRISELERQIPETVVVTEGGSVTLKPKDTEILKDDDIQLKFKGFRLAERKGVNGEITVHDDDHDGIFKDRLKLDEDSRSLVITDIRSDMSGCYDLRIIRRGHESLTTFYVCVMQRTLVVTEGGSVILKPKDTGILKDDDIQWKFRGSLIAERKGENGEITVHDDVHDGIFKGRLKLDKDSGSLIITDIRFTMSGRYDLRIIKRGHESLRTFSVSVVPKADDMATVSVKKGDTVTLSSGVTGIQRDEQIQWKFGLEGSPIAQIKEGTTKIFPFSADGRFRDKLKLDQNGSLTIKKIRPKDAGLYHLYNNTTGESMKSFMVDVRNPNDVKKNPEEEPLTHVKVSDSRL